MADPTTMSDEELADILASVAGDDAVITPPKVTPKAEAAKVAADVLEAVAGEGALEAVIAEVELTMDDASKVASGEVMADPDTEEKAIEMVKEATRVSAEEEKALDDALKADPTVKVVPDSEIPPEVAKALADEEEAYIPLPDKPIPVTLEADKPAEKKAVGVVYYIDPDRLKADVSINILDLDGALMTHASNFVHYAVQASNARRQFERMKAAFEIHESKLDNKWRTVLKEENPKTTEAQIRAAVVGDPTWSAANSRLIEARTIYELAQDAKEAFVMRRDTLLQLAKDAREERKGDMRVQAETDARARVDEKLREAKTAS